MEWMESVDWELRTSFGEGLPVIVASASTIPAIHVMLLVPEQS